MLLDEMSSLTFSTLLRGEHIGELTFVEDISIEFLCGPRCFPVVHCLNSLFLLVHYSISNVFLKVAKGPFEDRGETVKLICGPRILLIACLFIEIY